MKISKTFILILAVVFLISGGITAILAVNDAQAWQGNAVYPAENWEAYEAEWILELSPQGAFSIDFDRVDIVVTASSEQTVQASFTGYRLLPEQDGFQTGIVVEEDPKHLRISELRRGQTSRPRITLWDFSGTAPGGSGLRGTLTVAVPQDLLGDFEVSLFSGKVEAQGFAAASVNLDTSSGSITAEKLTAAGPFTADTFSGDVKLTDIQAQTATISTSSGSTMVSGLQCAFLSQEQFSGHLDLTNAQVTGPVKLSSSSGKVNLAQVEATSLTINTFSGDVAMQDCTATEQIIVDGSSSHVTCERTSAGQMELTTFSGHIRCPEVTTEKLTADTSSGDFDAKLVSMADLNVTSFSGEVQLNIPAESGFVLDLDTFSGSVDLGFSLTIQKPLESTGREIEGTVGSGAHMVYVSTSSGDISINPN